MGMDCPEQGRKKVAGKRIIRRGSKWPDKKANDAERNFKVLVKKQLP